MTLETLTEQVRNARRDVERAKISYYSNAGGTYDEMASAAKRLSNLLVEYQKAKFPKRKPLRTPYQAILR